MGCGEFCAREEVSSTYRNARGVLLHKQPVSAPRLDKYTASYSLLPFYITDGNPTNGHFGTHAATARVVDHLRPTIKL